ncbi:hypothetical protein RJT34_17614 [Clitoria ternatea]|uniref:Uncharacterized protein n=1 Tax=Clitoria ternatea TaxID=43366 RepID=A0AAN9J9A0_CLITE
MFHLWTSSIAFCLVVFALAWNQIAERGKERLLLAVENESHGVAANPFVVAITYVNKSKRTVHLETERYAAFNDLVKGKPLKPLAGSFLPLSVTKEVEEE